MKLSNFSKRSIADQTALSYVFYMQLDNTSGACTIGVSGVDDVTTVTYYCSGGRIYNHNNDYIYGYNANEWVNISGNIGLSGCDCYINNKPVYIGMAKQTGIYNTLYINPINTNITIYPQVFGEMPDYTISASGIYVSGQSLTGYFINNNPTLNFRVFSGLITDVNSNFTLSSFPTGNITNTGQFILDYISLINVSQTVPITFYTNFGEITGAFFTSGSLSYQTDEFFNFAPTTGYFTSGQTSLYTLNYNVTSGASFSVGLLATGDYAYWAIETGVSSSSLTSLYSGLYFQNSYYDGSGTGSGLPQTLVVSVSYSGISGYATLSASSLYGSTSMLISGV